eukprot:CAMPEP_0175083446 /NCGR_PEP_ID=MMETSP0052_2-20121109/27390_1 /TAXON_ID=51329 ORGANISM="Polytomella parva, Strain SAG 63-3" /NCGR_SAMPLE_ID=MMETSP0052_2 /ASSEMBLY_ACC=CAM_ASM_000194 /LENGTH=727 /DNA_ID=CAMNT_0016354903 /DNA_START=486 /DNA_END=2672 /DNA_ORIENTATION=-
MTTCDKLIWEMFGPSWVHAVELANITYWIVIALDPETSIAAASLGKGHCFNVPLKRHQITPQTEKFRWGSDHWTRRTWDKVRVANAVYSYGFHVIHSDTDATWFRNPLPFFSQYLNFESDFLLSTDLTMTMNPKNITDVERATHEHMNLNTGIYFIRYSETGLDLMKKWISVYQKDPHVGHDQDGFNSLVRGAAFRGDAKYGAARKDSSIAPYFRAAFNHSVYISALPTSSFANTYTFCNARAYELFGHDLFVVHWVWGGSTTHSKIQNIRDLGLYIDPPEYYHPRRLLSFELDQLAMPSHYNSIPESQTEVMIQFHIKAANYQLQQFYAAAAIAMSLDRVLVLPTFLCYCSKNWYMTVACRIHEANNALFPFKCPLSQLMRVQRILAGVQVSGWSYDAPQFPDLGRSGSKAAAPDASTGPTTGGGPKIFNRTLEIRERSFLTNHRTPKSYMEDRVVVDVSDKVLKALREMKIIADEAAKGDISVVTQLSELSTSKVTENKEETKPLNTTVGNVHKLMRKMLNVVLGKEDSTGSTLFTSEAGHIIPVDPNRRRTFESEVEGDKGIKSSKKEASKETEKKGLEEKPIPAPNKLNSSLLNETSTLDSDKNTLTNEKPVLVTTEVYSVTNQSYITLTTAPLNDFQLFSAFQPLASKKIIHLKWPRAMFSGFQDETLEKGFDLGMRNVTSYWCCRSPESQKKDHLPSEALFTIVPPLMPPSSDSKTPRIKE